MAAEQACDHLQALLQPGETRLLIFEFVPEEIVLALDPTRPDAEDHASIAEVVECR